MRMKTDASNLIFFFSVDVYSLNSFHINKISQNLPAKRAKYSRNATKNGIK